LNLLRNWIYSFKKIVLRIFQIEYFSTFAGDFAPIVVRIAGLLAVLVVLLENPSSTLFNAQHRCLYLLALAIQNMKLGNSIIF
jgi:hypothetical protein